MKGNGTSHAGELAGALLQCQTNPPCRILVVEDDIFILERNTGVLLRAGYEVDAAADGAAAWRALNTNGYDLLVTDNDMPKVTGIQLLMKLRAARMALPVILASGVMPTDELRRHPWLQIDATLLKPFTSDELLGTVATVLREAEKDADSSHPLMQPDTACVTAEGNLH